MTHNLHLWALAGALAAINTKVASIAQAASASKICVGRWYSQTEFTKTKVIIGGRFKSLASQTQKGATIANLQRTQPAVVEPLLWNSSLTDLSNCSQIYPHLIFRNEPFVGDTNTRIGQQNEFKPFRKTDSLSGSPQLKMNTNAIATELSGLMPHSNNPVIPGYYADPSLVQYEGQFFVYATLDPWGGDTLGCWESKDFRNWTYRTLTWPTVAACQSPTSGHSKVWAPSVVRGRDNRFYMYVSVGSEVWAGVADHPLGPWRNLLGDKPFIPGNYRPGFHMIDAEAFIDDDGSAWLYWGSGWNWENGRCFAAKLGRDMASFEGEVHDVTPANYFEAPFMVKRHGRYFLMYSSGRTDRETYQVRYAVGDTPIGPFKEASNSPILATDAVANVISPGHHAIFSLKGRDYIFYHRHSIPFDPSFIGRQLCIDEIRFKADGTIDKVSPTHNGPALVKRHNRGDLVAQAELSASSQAGTYFGPEKIQDNNYASRWAPSKEAQGAWLQIDFKRVRSFSRQEIYFEYAWKPYRFAIEVSNDGQIWQPLADFNQVAVSGAPVVIRSKAKSRFVRLVFPPDVSGRDISLFEWSIY